VVLVFLVLPALLMVEAARARFRDSVDSFTFRLVSKRLKTKEDDRTVSVGRILGFAGMACARFGWK
jgi:hypothetical protein